MQVLIFLVLVMMGCSGPMLVAKDGATNQDMQNDKYDCKQQWESSASGIVFRQDPLGHLAELSEVGGYMQACMERKGWHRVQ